MRTASRADYISGPKRAARMGTFFTFGRFIRDIDRLQPRGHHTMVRVVGEATDAAGGISAGCHTDHSIVRKAQPRRAQTLYSNSNRAKSGVGRPEVATFRPLRLIGTGLHSVKEALSLQPQWPLNLEVGPRSRPGGIILTRQELPANKMQTTRTVQSYRPASPICSDELKQVMT